jgi:membrane associated rhomboid family serine protease
VVTSLLLWFLAGKGMMALAFTGLSRPWTLFTYPWAYMPFDGFGLICFLLLVWWLLMVGGTVERELGTRKFALFMLAMAVVPALVLGLTAPILNAAPILAGPFLAVGGLTVAWGTRHPNSPVMLYGVLPLAAKWIALLTVAGTLFGFGFGNPLLGVLACSGYALAYAFASGKLKPFPYGRSGYAGGGFGGKKHANRAQAQYDEAYYDDVLRRERERDERERLRKLFESSLDEK